MLRVLLSRIVGTFRRRRLEDEFDDEVRAHLEMLQARFIRGGMDPADACDAARRQFGGVTQVKQDQRERRALPLVDVLTQDIRHAFRRLGRSKRFGASAVLTLALGIGATTTVFAALHAVVLQPLPYAEPHRLMSFRSLDRRGAEPSPLSYPNFLDFREQNRVFEHLVSYRDSRFTLTDTLPAIQVPGEIVSWDLFPLLGVQPALGRGFRPEEERPGAHVTVLSHALWTNRFGRDPAIVGKAVLINAVPFTVVGVAPEGFLFPVDLPGVQLWITLSGENTAGTERGARMLDVIGRLKPGVSAEQARMQMDVVAGALARQYPDHNSNFPTTVIRPELKRVAGRAETAMLILLGAVALVLLIACANVASLLLARSTERAREFALRMALGASRGALARQLLIESLVLGLLGTAGGVLLATAALQALLPLAGDQIPRLAETVVDGRVLIFSMILAVLTSVLFGLAPALQAAAADPADGLKEGGRGIAPGHDRFRGALVSGQIALGLVLLVGATLLMAGFVHMVRRDPGFKADHLLTFDIGLPGDYGAASQIAFSDRLLERMKAIPGVQAAGIGTPLPLQGHEMRVGFDIEERPAARDARPRSDMAIVTPGYFSAMGIPLLKGRDFTDQDAAGGPPVLVVNQAFARKFFPGEDAIGKRIRPGAGRPPQSLREIVGIVADATQSAIGSDADPIYYFPYKQLSWGIGTIVLRTAVPPLEVVPAARAELQSLDRQVPMSRIRTGEDLSAEVIATARFLTALMGGFAAIALVLTVVGLYGVLSYMVARRQREIGVRIALGAGRAAVIGMVWRRSALMVTAGLVLGSAGAVGAGRLLGSALLGVPVGIPLVVAVACAVMALTSSLATYIPAARAASVDPVQALRGE